MATDQDFTLVNVGDIADSGLDFATALMTDTCKIGRFAAGSWSLKHAGVACRLALDAKHVDFLQASGTAVRLIFQITLPLATDVLQADQIYVNSQLFVVDDMDTG